MTSKCESNYLSPLPMGIKIFEFAKSNDQKFAVWVKDNEKERPRLRNRDQVATCGHVDLSIFGAPLVVPPPGCPPPPGSPENSPKSMESPILLLNRLLGNIIVFSCDTILRCIQYLSCIYSSNITNNEHIIFLFLHTRHIYLV